jgi:eukaryotic-like serine/threonine-protein kinase
VLDFGVSKSIDALSEAPSPLTRTGALVGTPHYMALEQVDGSGTIDQRTDVYGFGVLLYRALTGYFPFDGSSLGEVILKIGTTQATAPRLLRPELSEELEAVIMRALSRDRNARFPELESFALALIPFVPPTYVTLDGSPRYSIMGDPRTASLGSIPPASGSRSVRSIVRDAPFPLTHSGLSLHGTGTQAPARYPSRALWAAALSVLLAIASIAAWALTRPAEQPDGGLGALPPTLPSPAEPPSPRGTALGQPAPVAAPEAQPAPLPVAPAPEQGMPGAEAPNGASAGASAANGAPGGLEQPGDAIGEPVAGPERVPNGPRKAKAQGAKAPKGSRVIPGDRTKGLSSDEF